ncbi:MAG: uroporphyrinogen decarboxylase family protein [Candidatus Neomarinimicrobiota bacterium]
MPSTTSFDYTLKDAQAMSVTPVEPADFDLGRYEAHALAADQRYAEFLRKKEGIAVWQRVRVGEVFRDGCRDMQQSLRWQLGGLAKSLAYATDAPTYLEPWYGIGITASAFGADYDWPEGQAPVVRYLYKSIKDVPELLPGDFGQVPIMRHTLETIEYFLEETRRCVPISWTDIQSPLSVAAQLVDISEFFLAFHEAPDKVKEMLAAVTDAIIDFTQRQSELIGDTLARPGHGFASSCAGTGIGLSDDNLVMISPRMYEESCVPNDTRIGAHFGGTAIHSCGNWTRWIEAVREIPNLTMVDGAFSPQTDPGHNDCEAFQDAFVDTGVIVQARIVGDSDEVLERVKRLWTPGTKLMVVTYVEDPYVQQQLYQDIHHLCA